MTGELEWGPWIDHDQCGSPVKDHVQVMVQLSDGRISGPYLSKEIGLGWCSCLSLVLGGFKIDKYRCRKPRGFTILENCLREAENPPDKAPDKMPEKASAHGGPEVCTPFTPTNPGDAP